MLHLWKNERQCIAVSRPIRPDLRYPADAGVVNSRTLDVPDDLNNVFYPASMDVPNTVAGDTTDGSDPR